MGMLKDQQQAAALGASLALCRQLAVSYTGLTLTLDMFPQVSREGVDRGRVAGCWLGG